MEGRPLQPFIKWPGGKRWAAAQVSELISGHLAGTYFEPFLGGAAVFFHLRPAIAILSDVNKELIATYQAVRRDPDAVTQCLRRYQVTKEEYYRTRAQEPRDAISRAGRFLYLNRTAFAGLYRVNLQGKFNVPFGGGERTPAVLWEREILAQAASALRRIRLKVSDFEPILNMAGPGDVAYCDPTYTVAHDNNGFVRYNERNFSWDDQQRLAKAAKAATRRGAFVVISNANHSSIRDLYPAAQFITLTRISSVTPRITLRRPVDELLIVPNP